MTKSQKAINVGVKITRGIQYVIIGIVCVFIVGGFIIWRVWGDDNPRIEVECQMLANGFTCLVKHVKGKSGLRGCWDIKIRCQNGEVATAHACQDVSKSERATKFISASEIENLKSCDRATSIRVTNLQVTRR